MEQIKIDTSMDLRGVSCPLNFLKTKLKLEQMKSGQILEILLDDGESIVNVPRSVKENGDKILEIKRIEDFFKVLIKKENPDNLQQKTNDQSTD